MAQVCYEIEQDKNNNFIIWQIFPDNRRYMKISVASMAWLVNQIMDRLRTKQRAEQLKHKARVSQVSKAQKMADFLFNEGGGDAGNSN